MTSLFVWAWNRVRPRLTAGQREIADYEGASFEVVLGKPSTCPMMGSQWVSLRAYRDPIAADNDFGWAACAFWRHRAGLKHPWNGQETEGNEAPKLVKPAPRKLREKPRRDELHAALSTADRKVAAKQKYLADLRKKKKSAEAAARTATRYIELATIQLAEFRVEASHARERMISATNTPQLTDGEFAARMKSKRETQGATCA